MIKIAHLLIVLFVSSHIYAQTPKRSDSFSLGDYNIYYEVYGEGTPLLLLHGYTQSSVSWRPYIQDYIDDYEVYLIDLTGHGKSSPFNHDLSIRSVAQDLNLLLDDLKLDNIKAIGFSFGGDVLYQLALLNPDLIENMITIGAVGTWTIKDFPEYLKSFTFDNRDNFPWLKDAHEGEEQVKALMEQFKNYNIELSIEELESIKPEVLIILGDDDEGLDLQEVLRARQHLTNSDLWILPNVAHSAHEGENKEDFIKKTKRFLSKK